MRPAITRLGRVVFVALFVVGAAGGVAAQTRQPLRKSDLIRHLSGSALSKSEIADLIRRNCLSFSPTDRDRTDLRSLGADDRIMRSIDGCLRHAVPVRVEPQPASVAAEVGSDATIVVKAMRGPEVERGLRLVLVGSSRIPGGPRRDVEATTDGLGLATFRVAAGTATGTYRLTVGAVGGEALEGRTTVSLETTPAGGVRIELRPARLEVRPGEDRRVPVVVVVRDGRARPLPGQPVELRSAVAGFSPLTATSDSQGAAAFSVPTGRLGRGGALSVRVRGQTLDSLVVTLPAVVSASRTGFVVGMGQRARVGTRLPQPLVFEVRDTANTPIVGRMVVFLAAGAQLEGVSASTDSAGRAQASVVLGDRAGPVVVSARVGAIERQAALTALAGPPARLVVMCGSSAVEGRLTIGADTTAVLRVAAQDAHGNVVPLAALRASIGDDGVLRQAGVTADSLKGAITFRPGRSGGTTNLAVQASGLRVNLIATVQPRGARGATCR